MSELFPGLEDKVNSLMGEKIQLSKKTEHEHASKRASFGVEATIQFISLIDIFKQDRKQSKHSLKYAEYTEQIANEVGLSDKEKIELDNMIQKLADKGLHINGKVIKNIRSTNAVSMIKGSAIDIAYRQLQQWMQICKSLLYKYTPIDTGVLRYGVSTTEKNTAVGGFVFTGMKPTDRITYADADEDAGQSENSYEEDALENSGLTFELPESFNNEDTQTLKNQLKNVSCVFRIENVTPYALYVHEIPFYNHKAPTCYKFMERAAIEAYNAIDNPLFSVMIDYGVAGKEVAGKNTTIELSRPITVFASIHTDDVRVTNEDASLLAGDEDSISDSQIVRKNEAHKKLQLENGLTAEESRMLAEVYTYWHKHVGNKVFTYDNATWLDYLSMKLDYNMWSVVGGTGNVATPGMIEAGYREEQL